MPVLDKPNITIRRGWFAVWAVYLIFVVAGTYPYLSSPGTFGPIKIIAVISDFIVIVGLYGYAHRKPIRSRWLGMLYLAVAYWLVLRIVTVVYHLPAILFPWEHSPEQYEAILTLAIVPLVAFAAYGLWQYGNEPKACA